MKFHLISLGCTKNTFDSEKVLSTLEKYGWNWTESPLLADILFINTCGFIKDAKEQSLETIIKSLELKKENKHQKTVVFGCLVKRYRKEIEEGIPEIDYLFDFLSKDDILSFAQKLSTKPVNRKTTSKRHLTPNHIGILKIAEGCSNRCAYCAIPRIRGDFRSRLESDIISDAKWLANSGVKELSIVAQDITRYGTDNGDNCQLPSLVKKISKISGIQWIRLHYLHPRGLSIKLIDKLFSIDKVVPYFDIPFQHVSDKMLTLMNRQTTAKHMLNIIDHIRNNYDNASIRTTLIVGFPKENEDDFQEMINFIEEYPIDRLGAFMYSTEEGTPAARMSPKVLKKVKQRRLDELMTLQQLLSSERNQLQIGKKLNVIIDKVENNVIEGRTLGDAYEIDNVVHAKISSKKKMLPGNIVKVIVKSADAYDLEADVI